MDTRDQQSTTEKGAKTMQDFNIGYEGQDYLPRAYFHDEMEAEKWMIENVLENGFYRHDNQDWYTVYEWITAPTGEGR